MMNWLLLACLLACNPTAQAQDAKATQNDPDALYLDAERAFLKNDIRGAAEKINAYFAQNPRGTSPKQYAKALNLRGLIYFQLKDQQKAMEEFGRAVQAASTTLPASDPVVHLTRYNLANSLYAASQIPAAADVLISVDSAALDAETRARYFHLHGNISLLQDNFVVATMDFVQAANMAKDAHAAEGYVLRASGAGKKLYLKNPRDDLGKLQSLAGNLDHNLAGTQALNVLIARGLLYTGRNDDAQELLKKFMETSAANHPMRARAQEMLDQMLALSNADPHTIGILLPLSGKFAKYGRLCLNSALHSLKVFAETPERADTKQIQFLVRDSGDSAESALEAFDKLVLEDRAIAVIGPLLSKQAPAVSHKAQEYGVPLLSLSQKRDAELQASFVFPIALSPEQQIETILEHAMGKMNLKRFALLAPEDAFGDEYVRLFWDSVEKRGGEIVGAERYAPKSTDFRDEIRRLLAIEYAEARGLEAAEWKKREEAYAATLKVKGNLRKRLLSAFELKPWVLFDAVFIPDDPQIVGQIVPAFAVRDVDNMPYLGINTWNTPELVQRAGRYLQQSLFVDAFFPFSKNPVAVKFVEEYNQQFQTVPGTLEVQTYDAASILLQALAAGELESRAKLRDRLINQGTFNGISGNFTFSEDGVKRTAYLLTVKGTNIAEVAQ